jgi:hypothetical protein
MYAITWKYADGKQSNIVERLNGIVWEKLQEGFPLPVHEKLWDIAHDVSGNIIVAAEDVIVQFDPVNNVWKKHEFEDSLKGDRSFHHLFTDSQGRTWITGEGRAITRRDTIQGVPVQWGTVYNEVFMWNGTDLDLKFRSTPNPTSWFSNPAEDSDGNIWIAYHKGNSTIRGGFLKYEGESFKIIDSPVGSNVTWGPTPQSIYFDTFGKMYVGSRQYRDRSGNSYPSSITTINFESSTGDDVTLSPYVANVYELLKYGNTLYIGTGGQDNIGLLYTHGGTVDRIDYRQRFVDYSEFSQMWTTQDIEMVDNKLWCATGWGVVVLDLQTIVNSISNTDKMSIAARVIPHPVKAGQPAIIQAALHQREGIVSAYLVNSLGERVHEQAFIEHYTDHLRLDTRNLNAGVHFLRITTSSSQKIIPVVIE